MTMLLALPAIIAVIAVTPRLWRQIRPAPSLSLVETLITDPLGSVIELRDAVERAVERGER